jgi:hypothetical protein
VPYTGFLDDKWPRFSKQGLVLGTDWDQVGRALMDECGAIGAVNIDNSVRGPGGWLGHDGNLVFHCGDIIYTRDQAFKPGRIGEHVYPSAPAIPHPAQGRADSGAAEQILDFLKTWNWRRPDMDPHLLLGWIGAAMLGGALRWRPVVWVTGDKATGKSTLQKLIGLILDERAMIASVDATEAGIRQAVGKMSLPVTLDELEADVDNRRADGLIKLARFACSGGRSHRGGANHEGSQFTLSNCFLFSSILVPGLQSQDVSRMAILHLDKLEDGAIAPALKPEIYKQFGQILRRRLMDRWQDFPAILEAYRVALQAAGHGGRSGDVFGTLLACHDLLLFDGGPDPAIVQDCASRMQYSAMSEAEDDIADWQRCFNHLVSSPLDFYRNGEKRSVGEWILGAAGKKNIGVEPPEANRALGGYGLRVRSEEVLGKTFWLLQIANAHQGLAPIFRETQWGSRPGAQGVWVQSLRRAPNSIVGKKPTSFGGVMTRFTEIYIDQFIQKIEGGEACLRA